MFLPKGFLSEARHMQRHLCSCGSLTVRALSPLLLPEHKLLMLYIASFSCEKEKIPHCTDVVRSQDLAVKISTNPRQISVNIKTLYSASILVTIKMVVDRFM